MGYPFTVNLSSPGIHMGVIIPFSDARITKNGWWGYYYLETSYWLFEGYKYSDGTYDGSNYGVNIQLTWIQYGSNTPMVKCDIDRGNVGISEANMRLKWYIDKFNALNQSWIQDGEAHYNTVPYLPNNGVDIMVTLTGYTFIDGTVYRLRIYPAGTSRNYSATYGLKINSITIDEKDSGGIVVDVPSTTEIFKAPRIFKGSGQFPLMYDDAGVTRPRIAPTVGNDYYLIYAHFTGISPNYDMIINYIYNPNQTSFSCFTGKDRGWDWAGMDVELGRFYITNTGLISTICIDYVNRNPNAYFPETYLS